MLLFIDTETTGIPDWRLPSTDPAQPHIVSYSHILTGDNGKIEGEYNTIIKPDGWTIPEEAIFVHGITTEVAARDGIDEAVLASMYLAMQAKADLIVGHNIAFDTRIMRIAMLRHTMFDRIGLDAMKRPIFCTMKACADKFNGGHWPKLETAYEYLFHKPIAGAHNAANDVRACMEIYFAIR
jgi:DNA polymerase III subunit epsilon